MVISEPAGLQHAQRIVLPGVGAFAKAMERLDRLKFLEPLHRAVHTNGVPILGICLGMQLMLAIGEEGGPTPGLGWIDGHVRRLVPQGGERIPHVGWNTVDGASSCVLFESLPPARDFYFVHSYHVSPVDPSVVVGCTPFAGGFVSAVQQGTVFGVQFHPEKSQTSGFKVLENFLRLAG
jgi:glutamine amidotransferase